MMESDFEENEIIKKYFSRIFTVLPMEVRLKLMSLDISERTFEKLKRELAFLPEEQQNEYLDEIHRIYKETIDDYKGKKE